MGQQKQKLKRNFLGFPISSVVSSFQAKGILLFERFLDLILILKVVKHMESVGTVNFEDLFDFSPEPLDSPLEESDEKLDFGQGQLQQDQFTQLINQPPVEYSSNRSQGTSSQVSSPLADSYGVSPIEQLSSSVGTKSKRGRKPNQKSLKSDMKSKLERSRQSARECRARKKLRYQYLDDLLLEREKANIKLRDELIVYQKWCHEMDKGRIPDGLQEMLKEYTTEINAESSMNKN